MGDILQIPKNKRTPKLNYKIRQLTKGNWSGEAFGITVPFSIAKLFTNMEMRIVLTGSGFGYVKKEEFDNVQPQINDIE